MRNVIFYSLLSLGTMVFAQTSVLTIPLNEGWQFREYGRPGPYRSATVPGTVYTDLMKHGLIPDPYYRTNEREVQWVDKTDWDYRLIFQVSADWLRKDQAELTFLGLDTYAEVYLNDTLIIQADNFFIPWSASVKKWLRPGENTLRLRFRSPIQFGLQKLAAHGFPLPASNDQSENGDLGDKRVSIFTRKPGYHYGWDWGPRLVTSGIWRPVQLSFWDEAKLTNVFLHQKTITETKAELVAQVTLENEAAGQYQIMVSQGDQVLAVQSMTINAGTHQLEIPFVIHQPQLWWTHDQGRPHLYTFKVRVSSQNNVLDEMVQRIGLRTIKVIQTPDVTGHTFYFELNGRPIFCKGANYIPNDVFIPRVTIEHYRRLIQAAKDGNMNMLRVWGGGFYEEDVFYDLCDEYGILVWQDFMFACSMYPGDADFLAKVREEAEYNVMRLRHHPCIALWCGNNEIDVAWAQYNPQGGWGWKTAYTPAQRDYIWQAYEEIFHKILPEVVKHLHPEVYYWPSSPYEQEGKHSHYQSTSGDIHYWGVWHGLHPFEDFYRYLGRFMSEYGFQSFPEMRTVQVYTVPEDWNIESTVMAAHQRSGIGNLRIRSYMEQDYRVPEQFADLLYVGQLLQAEGIKMAIEAHRAAKPYTMGTLYWQINDCWPVASWSGMDYYQRWKALHYFVKKAFQPATITGLLKNDRLTINIVSDDPEPLDARAEVRLLDFKGKVLKTKSYPVTIMARQAVLVDTLALTSWLKKISRSGHFIQLRLWREKEVLHQNQIYFVAPKDLDLPRQSGLSASIMPAGDQYNITLQTSALAKNVYLDFPAVEGFFSDNYFDLIPGQPVIVTFTPHKKTALTHSDLKIMSVVDTY